MTGMGRLQDRVALVTGAGSGIGRAIAVALHREGALVMATDIREETVRALANELGGRIRFCAHDVGREEDWERAMALASDAFGPISVLVNNAGVVLLKDLVETSLAEWRAQNAVNLDGTFLGVRAGILAMREGKAGRIINISSVNGLVGVHTAPAYSASKGGVTAFTKSAALYCAAHGYDITVNSIHPGYVETKLVQDLADQLGTDRQRVLKQFSRSHPIGRLGTPEDIAEGVIYLASESGRWITGSELVIDGGYLAQ